MDWSQILEFIQNIIRNDPSFILLIILGIIAYFKYLRPKIGKIDRLEKASGSILKMQGILLESHQFLLSRLANKDVVSEDEVRSFSQKVIQQQSENIEELIKSNPISEDEIDKLTKYIRMAKKGDDFKPDEAEEFLQLAGKIKKETFLPSHQKQDIWTSAVLVKSLSDWLENLEKLKLSR